MLYAKFQFIWPSGFRGEDFWKLANPKQELPVAAMFVNGSEWNEQSLVRTFHRCFLQSFSSFDWVVSEEKIKMWKVKGWQTTDDKWWQKWAKNENVVKSRESQNFGNKAGTAVVMIVWQLDLQLSVQSVPITTEVVRSNPAHGEVFSIQHYVIKFVSDLRQIGGFLRVLRFPQPIKLTEILLKVALNTIT